jgi:hypothetical protein
MTATVAGSGLSVCKGAAWTVSHVPEISRTLA